MNDSAAANHTPLMQQYLRIKAQAKLDYWIEAKARARA